MSLINRFVRCLPACPHSSQIKKVPEICTQVTCKYHLDSAIVKSIEERWPKLQALLLNKRIKQKRALNCNTPDVTHCAASINRKDGARGEPSHETLSVAPEREVKCSQFLDMLLPWSASKVVHLDWWQNTKYT